MPSPSELQYGVYQRCPRVGAILIPSAIALAAAGYFWSYYGYVRSSPLEGYYMVDYDRVPGPGAARLLEVLHSPLRQHDRRTRIPIYPLKGAEIPELLYHQPVDFVLPTEPAVPTQPGDR